MVVPPKHPKWSFLVGKPLVVGYHHFRKPPYIHPPKLRWQWNTNRFWRWSTEMPCKISLKRLLQAHGDSHCLWFSSHPCLWTRGCSHCLGGPLKGLGYVPGVCWKILRIHVGKVGKHFHRFSFLQSITCFFFFVPWISWQVNHHPSFFDLPHTYMFRFSSLKTGVRMNLLRQAVEGATFLPDYAQGRLAGKKLSTVSCEGQPCPGFVWIYILNICLAILCALFGMVKWPFQRLSDLQLGDEKVTLNHLVCVILPSLVVGCFLTSIIMLHHVSSLTSSMCTFFWHRRWLQ